MTIPYAMGSLTTIAAPAQTQSTVADWWQLVGEEGGATFYKDKYRVGTKFLFCKNFCFVFCENSKIFLQNFMNVFAKNFAKVFAIFFFEFFANFFFHKKSQNQNFFLIFVCTYLSLPMSANILQLGCCAGAAIMVKEPIGKGVVIY